MKRICVICGACLDGRRKDALYCGGPCRTEASRIRRLLDGEQVGPYGCLDDRLRTKRSTGRRLSASRPERDDK